jgi:isopentenyl diphosphate isomerase/L-lactate dehydrogenase-like FMN-dependent dehydrogenase
MGGAGVSSALEVIRESFENAMILTGVNKVSEISRDNLLKAPLKN